MMEFHFTSFNLFTQALLAYDIHFMKVHYLHTIDIFFCILTQSFNHLSFVSMHLSPIVNFNVVFSTGSVIYSEVSTFLKKEPLVIVRYLAITTFHNVSLTLSPDHLVYARKYAQVEFYPM